MDLRSLSPLIDVVLVSTQCNGVRPIENFMKVSAYVK